MSEPALLARWFRWILPSIVLFFYLHFPWVLLFLVIVVRGECDASIFRGYGHFSMGGHV